MTEEWRSVVGYEGRYEVSDQGRVRSLERIVEIRPGVTKVQPGRILKHVITHLGYPIITLPKNQEGRRKNVRVQRLVLEAFVGPCPPGMEACHNDDVSLDCRLQNLRWDTRQANIADRCRNGR